ncbi:MAG: ABC transporter permease [Actinomycetota bacterium]|nr:ABC transporter permease [Acidimicrobiia bacterium]MDQ3293219.1 ABC transporter permease [Actinomycetota bacterium]
MALATAPARQATGAFRSVGVALGEMGSFLLFAERVLVHTVWDVVIRQRFRKEVIRQISDIVVGAGAYLAGGGMLFVIAAMSFATGATVGVEGFNGLRGLGAESFTGLVASFGNVREITPIIAAIALAAQVGAGFTAEIGAKRISEEIDALEVMGVPPLIYLVCTRLVATLTALVPLYFISLFASFFASRFVTTTLLGLSPGIYDHYFHMYLPPVDILYSVIKVTVFAVLVVIIHCYYGFYATGGPAGVGIAVGQAIRMTIIVIVLVNLFLSFLFWGTSVTVSLTG